MHKCINNCAPRYLADSIRPLSDDNNRSRLRSSKSADVTIPRTKTKMSDWAFRVAGPRAWYNLPGSIQAHQDSSCVQETVKAPAAPSTFCITQSIRLCSLIFLYLILTFSFDIQQSSKAS